MDMKKLIEIVDGTKSALSESAVQECGQMMGAAPAQEPSMNINLNASGLGNIRDIINMLNAIEHGEQPSNVPPMPTPGMGVVPTIDVVADHDSEIEDKAKMDPLSKIKALAGLKSDDESHEKLEDDTDYPNSPDVTVDDVDALTTKFSGGLNKQHQQPNPGYQSDNPLTLESDLRKLYNTIKESWDNYELEEGSDPYDDGNPYYGTGRKTIEAEVPAPYDYTDEESNDPVTTGESVLVYVIIDADGDDFTVERVMAGDYEFDIHKAGEHWVQRIKELVDDDAQED
jgi:hypothetical protein